MPESDEEASTQASTSRNDRPNAAPLPKAEKGKRRVIPEEVESFLSKVYAEAIDSSMVSVRKVSMTTVRQEMPKIQERYPHLLPSTIRDKLWTIATKRQRSGPSKSKNGSARSKLPVEAASILENIFDAEIQFSVLTGKKVAISLIRQKWHVFRNYCQGSANSRSGTSSGRSPFQ